jgi:hypothetical protein
MANGDKRSVSTDTLETLGTILGEGQGRDAIHLAVEPAIAAEDLMVGQHVGFKEGGMGSCAETLGIVDPFLLEGPRKGERFWLVVYPRQITSLRHVWSHPAFPESDVAVAAPPIHEKSVSEAWLRNFCETNDCPCYETVMEVITSEDGVQLGEPEYYGKTRNEGGEYLTFWGIDAHCAVPSEFWDHVEIVTGKKISQRPTYFSCSC